MAKINDGDKGERIKSFQRSINNRLKARGFPTIDVDGEFGPKTRKALVTACYLLGMSLDEIDGIKKGSISNDEQTFVRNPGKRSAEELALAKKRVAAHRKVVARRKASAAQASAKRKRICTEAKKAAANYRKAPSAYHYLAGGTANTIYLSPSPRTFRSDCSQFGASVYKGAKVDSPASPLAYQWASTFSIVKSPHASFHSKAERKPGMIGMYGSREAPHHMELYIGDPDVEFIGHGSPPIDSLTPGQPDYYVDFDFLN